MAFLENTPKLQSRAAEVYYAAKQAGATDAVAAAIAGFAYRESRFSLFGDNTKNNRGIFNASDRMGLQHLQTLGAQTARYLSQLQRNSPSLWSQMQSATNPQAVLEAMKASGKAGFGFGYPGAAVEADRIAASNQYLSQFGGTPIPPQGNIASRTLKTIGHQIVPAARSTLGAAIPIAASAAAGPGAGLAAKIATPYLMKPLLPTTPKSVQ